MIKDLIGKTLVKIEGGIGDDEMVFSTKEGPVYRMWHSQD